jgi:hypothetical protein
MAVSVFSLQFSIFNLPYQSSLQATSNWSGANYRHFAEVTSFRAWNVGAAISIHPIIAKFDQNSLALGFCETSDLNIQSGCRT